MSPRWFRLITLLFGILILSLAPVEAAPALAVGNRADYSLAANLILNTTCTVDQPLYWAQVCGYGAAVSTSSPSNITGSSTILWVDQGSCPVGNVTVCRFSPLSLTITAGSLVQWVHNGTLTHTVTADTTANGSLPGFDSGPVPPGSSYSHSFALPGNYSYYCAIHPWMRGKVIVVGNPLPVPAPTPPSVTVNLVGAAGWTVRGLSSTSANLQVDHNASISVSPLPLVSYMPVVEQGSFSQSVNLATRVETPGTVAGLLREFEGSIGNYLLTAYARQVPGLSGYSSGLVYNFSGPDYTMWWVNGPLTLGSPVQILHGSASVTGDESLSLPGSIGVRSAWIVTSDMSQSLNASSAGSDSRVAFRLGLLWSFDKQGDLLLRSSSNASFTAWSMSRTLAYSYPYVNLYGYYYPLPVQPVWVMVTRSVTVTVAVTLRLVSTDLNLNTRFGSVASSNSPSSSSSLNPSSLPWGMYAEIGLIAASVVIVVIWGGRRRMVRRSTPQIVSPSP